MYIKSHINALFSDPLLLGIFFVLLLLFGWILRAFRNSLLTRYGIGLVLVGVFASFFPAGEVICLHQELLSRYCELEFSAAFITLTAMSYLLVAVPYAIIYYISNAREKRLELERAKLKEEQEEENYALFRKFQAMDDDELEQYFEDEMAEIESNEKDSH